MYLFCLFFLGSLLMSHIEQCYLITIIHYFSFYCYYLLHYHFKCLYFIQFFIKI